MHRVVLLSCALIALLGCRRQPTSDIQPPIDETDPDPKPSSTKAAPAGPGTLEMVVAACAIAPDRRVWCRDSDLLEVDAGWVPDAEDVEQIWLVDETLCLRSAGQVRCLYPEDPLEPPFPGDASGKLTSPSGRPVVDVAWAMDHQCLVDDEGALWCRWLPYEEGVPLPPLERYPIAEVVEIEASDELGCMRLADDSVYCYFASGMVLISELDSTLGATVAEHCEARPDAPHCNVPLGGRADWPAPFRVLDRGGDMAVGSNYACLIDFRGTVGCVSLMPTSIGTNLGGTQDFAAIPGLPPMVELDGSDDHVCGRSEADEVWCWGSNEYGQLGDGTTTSHAQPMPVKVGQWPGLRQISVGFAKSCAVTNDAMECWGWLGYVERDDPEPTEIPGVVASELVSREYTTCAREAKGWKCWGAETGGIEGALGAARIVEVAKYVDRPAPECILDDQRRLTCVDDRGMPTVDIANVVAAAPGYTDLCLLLDRRVECFSPSLPTYGKTEFEVPASTAISGLDWHGCVLDTRGKAHCWDDELGLKAAPVDAKLVDVVATAAGDCGLDNGGKVWCWGEWVKDGRPVALGLPKIVELVGGINQTCARDLDGKVWCWGRGVQPGRDAAPQDPLEMAVPVSAQIVSGFDHFCSRATDGRVSCWGSEIESQRARISPDFMLKPEKIDFFGP
jgi:hypothetical protein